jgi:hypothetical protein
MGRMLRMRQWGMSVLPAPFPDNGIELNGSKFIGQALQIDYAVYGVSGFKSEARPLDLDFKLSRSPQSYYIDNNARPTAGGRVSLTYKLGDSSDATLGASGMWGTYDPGSTRRTSGWSTSRAGRRSTRATVASSSTSSPMSEATSS